MHQREAGQIIGLQQREGRARDFDRWVACQMADQGARERGLARAEVAGERDEISRLERNADVLDQALHRLFVRQHHGVT